MRRTTSFPGKTPRGRHWAARALAFCAGLFAFGVAGADFVAASEKDRTAQREKTAAQREQNRFNLVGHGGPVKTVHLNASGTRALTGSFDYSMIYWDISGDDPKILGRFDEHDGAVNAVRFFADGSRAIAGGDDGKVWIWNLDTGTLVKALDGHTAKVVDIEISPDGRFAASASWDRSVRLWDLEELTPGPVMKGHTAPVNAVAFTARAGKTEAVYSAGADGTVRHWDMETGELKRAIYRHGWGINCLKALPEPGKLLFGSLNGEAGIIDAESGTLSTVLNPHEGPVLALAISPAHKLIATGGGDGGVNIWSTEDWALKEQHQNPYGPVWGLAFAHDAKKIYYSGLDDFVTLWQVSPRQAFEVVPGRFPRRFQARENMSLGELQFARKCSVCHTISPDGGNRAGPTLFGVFGRRAGTVPGYAYSPALLNSDIVWNEETIGQLFDHGPQHVTPGSKMPLQQIEDAEKRNALIAYLKAAQIKKSEQDTAPKGAPTSKE